MAEYVIFDTALRDALLHQTSFGEVETLLQKRGFQSMWDRALHQVSKGVFELKEVIQVIGKDT